MKGPDRRTGENINGRRSSPATHAHQRAKGRLGLAVRPYPLLAPAAAAGRVVLVRRQQGRDGGLGFSGGGQGDRGPGNSGQEAVGFVAILTGVLASGAYYVQLLAAMMPVLDALYTAFSQ